MALGVLVTLTRSYVGRGPEVYAFLKNLHVLTSTGLSTRINPVQPSGRAGLPSERENLIASREYGELLVEVWRQWERDGRPFELSPISNWLAGRGSSCENSGECARHFLGVDHTGAVSNCSRFLSSRSSFGNLWTAELTDVLRHPLRHVFDRRAEVLQSGACKDCRLWDRCGGGCPHDGAPLEDGTPGPTVFCEGVKLFFDAVERAN
jgi:radical SAM protein with 4Fe4S-binding SPASM domain